VQVNRRQMQNSDTASTQSSPEIKIEARQKRGPLLFQLWFALLVCFTLPWLLYLDTVLDLRSRLLFSMGIFCGSFFALIAWVQLSDRDIVLRVDENGIYDRYRFVAPIPWAEIKSVQRRRITRGPVIFRIDVDCPECFLIDRTKSSLLDRFVHSYYVPMSICAEGLTVSTQELHGALDAWISFTHTAQRGHA
jgi:hypothetical protein